MPLVLIILLEIALIALTDYMTLLIRRSNEMAARLEELEASKAEFSRCKIQAVEFPGEGPKAYCSTPEMAEKAEAELAEIARLKKLGTITTEEAEALIEEIRAHSTNIQAWLIEIDQLMKKYGPSFFNGAGEAEFIAEMYTGRALLSRAWSLLGMAASILAALLVIWNLLSAIIDRINIEWEGLCTEYWQDAVNVPVTQGCGTYQGPTKTFRNPYLCDAIVTVSGHVDDDVIIDGQIWNATIGGSGYSKPDCKKNTAHSFIFRKRVGFLDTVTVSYKDNHNVRAGIDVYVEFRKVDDYFKNTNYTLPPRH